MEAIRAAVRQALIALGCCLLQICCPPAKQREALASVIRNHLLADVPVGAGVREDALAWSLAEELLGVVDLAPLGLTEAVKGNWRASNAELGAAVRALYEPAFAEAAAQED